MNQKKGNNSNVRTRPSIIELTKFGAEESGIDQTKANINNNKLYQYNNEEYEKNILQEVQRSKNSLILFFIVELIIVIAMFVFAFIPGFLDLTGFSIQKQGVLWQVLHFIIAFLVLITGCVSTTNNISYITFIFVVIQTGLDLLITITKLIQIITCEADLCQPTQTKQVSYWVVWYFMFALLFIDLSYVWYLKIIVEYKKSDLYVTKQKM